MPMNLTQMVMEAEADLRNADSEVELTQAEIERAQEANAAARQRQANMRATYDWLSQRLKDHPDDKPSTAVGELTPTKVTQPEPRVKLPESERAQTPESDPVAEARIAPSTRKVFGKPVPEVTLSSLTVEALEQLGRAATTAEVRLKLQENGHQYDQGQVRHSLKYLARKQSSGVENPRVGIWQLRRSGARSLGPVGPAESPAVNGHRGEP
jgi:hypothetical protein